MENIQTLYNKEAEEAVIGGVLINPQAIKTLTLRAGHFYNIRLRHIWAACIKLEKNSEPIDILMIANELERVNKLEMVGGSAELTKLVNRTPTALHIEAYADLVIEYHARRQWLQLASDIAKTAFDKNIELEIEMPTIIKRLTATAKVKGTTVPASEFADIVLNETLERMGDPKDIWGLETGFRDFDQITGGIQQNEVMYISGPPEIGKSIIAGQMAYNMAKNNIPGIVYSMEMPGVQFVRRQITTLSRVQSRLIKSGRLSNTQLDDVADAVGNYTDLPLYISEDVMWTTASLRVDIARMQAEHDIKWFVLDYAYLLRDNRDLSETDRTGLISSMMKMICRELNVAGIVIHSLVKAGIGKKAKPGGEHIRGSGQQFYDADIILFMSETSEANVILCSFGKGRELENSKLAFNLVKIANAPAFGDISYQKESDNGRHGIQEKEREVYRG